MGQTSDRQLDLRELDFYVNALCLFYMRHSCL